MPTTGTGAEVNQEGGERGRCTQENELTRLANIRIYQASIYAYVLDHERGVRAAPWAMLNCLDSGYELRSWSSMKKLREENPSKVDFAGDAVVFTGDFFFQWVTGPQVLFGYDEVWLFSEKPTASVPEEFWFQPEFHPELLDVEELTEWMNATGALVGLCDGQGLVTASLYPETWQDIETEPHSRV